MSHAIQTWSQQPRYQEVNPKGTVILPCNILNKKGECRWEHDGSPIGIQPQKYEWSSTETGDCSLRIIDASLEYDDGVWQCQVTPSSFSAKDALVSEGAELVVRGEEEVVYFFVGVLRKILTICSSGSIICQMTHGLMAFVNPAKKSLTLSKLKLKNSKHRKNCFSQEFFFVYISAKESRLSKLRKKIQFICFCLTFLWLHLKKEISAKLHKSL